MPTHAQHIRQAEWNERAVRVLDQADYSEGRLTDWEVTALFYSALHYVDAFLDFTVGLHPRNHRARNELVTSRTAIGLYYLRLYHRSLDARYDVVSIPSLEVDRIHMDDFSPIKDNMRALLNLS
jgi:uncharacterized protein (UPF0332 family)